jgi:DNA invertase Pin-like site-specific DNA recombinase
MKAILYHVVILNDEIDKKRQELLENFLENNDIEIVNTYYDVMISDYYQERKGLMQLLSDLSTDKVKADAFICMSVKDIGRRKFLIRTLTEINSYVPLIYFTDIEQSNSNDIA